MVLMQHLGGAVFDDFKRRDCEYLDIKMATQESLMETHEFTDWLPVPQALGADTATVQTFVGLSQQSHAGRIYANALLVNWMKKALDGPLDYTTAPQAMQSDLRKAC